ncbi:MAG: hypothetical protein IM537_18770 [Pseudanabaena sp. M57BS1SP1A06MG]|nr:hypothetical protein [Pseudanabaena sp. M34BS1SP1A06MG]MCA6591484.1 hypothetical protein [Pseudanabaena sp. M38BS1SP1A06MG]MCA6602193.1 hypothetical protein [Pseudanabaena sp. M57BS1SP1A06MG]
MQLDIFSIVPNGSSGELPSANIPLEPETLEALELLEEVAKLAIKPELVEGCTVRSRTAFKGRTAKLLRFEQIHEYRFAVVQIQMHGSLIEYSCNVDNLEVVE